MFEIPDEAVVVRLGEGRRTQYEHNVELTFKIHDFRAFSVRASTELSGHEIAVGSPGTYSTYLETTGLTLRRAGLESKKTFKDPLHYSVLAPDGITDVIWGKIEKIFGEPRRV